MCQRIIEIQRIEYYFCQLCENFSKISGTMSHWHNANVTQCEGVTCVFCASHTIQEYNCYKWSMSRGAKGWQWKTDTYVMVAGFIAILSSTLLMWIFVTLILLQKVKLFTCGMSIMSIIDHLWSHCLDLSPFQVWRNCENPIIYLAILGLI